MSTKKSSTWEHFTLDPANCTVVVSNVCDIKLLRSMTAKFSYYPVLAGYKIYKPVHPNGWVAGW